MLHGACIPRNPLHKYDIVNKFLEKKKITKPVSLTLKYSIAFQDTKIKPTMPRDKQTAMKLQGARHETLQEHKGREWKPPLRVVI